MTELTAGSEFLIQLPALDALFGSTMLTLVFFVGVINLVVGFTLAIALERRFVIPIVRIRPARKAQQAASHLAAAPAAEEVEPSVPPAESTAASQETDAALLQPTGDNDDDKDGSGSNEPAVSLSAAAM